MTLAWLKSYYVRDIEEEKADEFISNSEKIHKNLKYEKGEPKNKKPGFVGIYYRTRTNEV